MEKEGVKVSTRGNTGDGGGGDMGNGIFFFQAEDGIRDKGM